MVCTFNDSCFTQLNKKWVSWGDWYISQRNHFNCISHFNFACTQWKNESLSGCIWCFLFTCNFTLCCMTNKCSNEITWDLLSECIVVEVLFGHNLLTVQCTILKVRDVSVDISLGKLHSEIEAHMKMGTFPLSTVSFFVLKAKLCKWQNLNTFWNFFPAWKECTQFFTLSRALCWISLWTFWYGASKVFKRQAICWRKTG